MIEIKVLDNYHESPTLRQNSSVVLSNQTLGCQYVELGHIIIHYIRKFINTISGDWIDIMGWL